MVPGVEIGVEDARDFFRRYEAVLSETTAVANEEKWKRITDNLDVVKAKFNLHKGSPVPDEVISERLKKICTIHPEAALMPLAYAHCHGMDGTVPIDSDVDLDALIPAEGNVFLGASRPCCWSCFDLKERLASERLIDGRIYFVFPGTHATILPCMPPPGVPEGELAWTWDKLFYILHRRICAPKLGRGLLHLLEVDKVDMLELRSNISIAILWVSITTLCAWYTGVRSSPLEERENGLMHLRHYRRLAPRDNGDYSGGSTRPIAAEVCIGSSATVRELHTLRKRCRVREVERACAPADILLPRITARLAAPVNEVIVSKLEHRERSAWYALTTRCSTRRIRQSVEVSVIQGAQHTTRSYLVTTKGSANLRAARAYVHLQIRRIAYGQLEATGRLFQTHIDDSRV
ncbi:hypothetical protein NUW54_g7902 [Trametes sanguinea]|uniref:Uncharacterized protein n=1 Tax=Trametes sanguinea TaxID=158606 RepID=A0ACC1PIQ0_9APHY|nr:hypothetical protein NUW54_g7902 [Trametes sanguinea]